jgi:L,D-transpeptidase catalytic domain/FlgD Ig-like domain
MNRLYALTLSTALITAGVSIAVAGSPPLPAAPVNLSQFASGKAIPAGSWSHSLSATLKMQGTGTGASLTPQVEIEPAGHAFTGQPTAHGAARTFASGATGRLSVAVMGLKNARSYIWQARVVDNRGTPSPWTAFTSGSKPALRIDTVPPSTPQIVSTSGIKWNHWSRSHDASFKWSSTDSLSGVDAYSYSFGHKVQAPRSVPRHETSTTFSNAPNGQWVLRVWSRDVAGNWSHLAFYRFNIFHRIPEIHFLSVSTADFNPYAGGETWTFSLSSRAHVSVQIQKGERWTVMTRKLGKLKRGSHTFAWNGRGPAGHVVPPGHYSIRVITVDGLGNSGTFTSSAIHVAPFKPTLPYYPRAGKHIVVSLTKEAIYAYNGTRLVTWSLATTGNPALPTPTGHFSIIARFSPFEFISPWPQGSPYYYPPSWVSYAMEFQSAGYFIHDAPWRSVYGPGSNGPGQPGTNYGGTHGCVNVPFDMAKFLWGWSTIGTPVDVVA